MTPLFIMAWFSRALRSCKSHSRPMLLSTKFGRSLIPNDRGTDPFPYIQSSDSSVYSHNESFQIHNHKEGVMRQFLGAAVMVMSMAFVTGLGWADMGKAAAPLKTPPGS